MTLTKEQIDIYRTQGHLTVPAVFSGSEMDSATADAMVWAEEFQAGLSAEERAWYLERATAGGPIVRKLDNPVFHRPAFRRLAESQRLAAMVAQLIGPGLRVVFSQIFFEPPEVGGPKPMHQDNFYFGCDDRDGMVTAWIALDAATVENGCLHFGDGSNRGPVFPHVAPPDKPFDLQLTEEEALRHTMTPAPVPRGGVSFRHGNTLHQSSANRSKAWRRAAAFHYVNAQTQFATPALSYDSDVVVFVG